MLSIVGLLILGFLLILLVGYGILAIVLTANKKTRGAGIAMLCIPPVLLVLGAALVFPMFVGERSAYDENAVQMAMPMDVQQITSMQQQIEQQVGELPQQNDELRRQYEQKEQQYQQEIQRLKSEIEKQEHEAADDHAGHDHAEAVAESAVEVEPETVVEAVEDIEPEAVDETEADEPVAEAAEESASE